jgi:hypothetical protein
MLICELIHFNLLGKKDPLFNFNMGHFSELQQKNAAARENCDFVLVHISKPLIGIS